MKHFKKAKSKSILIILIIIGTITLLITVGQRYKIKVIQDSAQYLTTPLQKGLGFVTGYSNDIVGKFQNIASLEEKNKALEEEMAQLAYEKNILDQFKEENEKLKALLQLKERYKQYPSEGANIIAKEPGNWYKVFVIDKGAGEGLNKDDAILSGGGLAGHVIEVGPLASKVLTIIDDRSSVSAAVLRTGEIGILKGDIELTGQGFCKFEIDIQSEVIKGDQIITSHLSDIYPPGITIGFVEEIIIAKNGLTQSAYVRPVVDFNYLKQVLVLHTKGS